MQVSCHCETVGDFLSRGEAGKAAREKAREEAIMEFVSYGQRREQERGLAAKGKQFVLVSNSCKSQAGDGRIGLRADDEIVIQKVTPSNINITFRNPVHQRFKILEREGSRANQPTTFVSVIASPQTRSISIDRRRVQATKPCLSTAVNSDLPRVCEAVPFLVLVLVLVQRKEPGRILLPWHTYLKINGNEREEKKKILQTKKQCLRSPIVNK
ncbi:uncharacterized protein LY89DRAFT_668531 [Mollisia scopiformis]|uniref:Uncharacterized protein n=1 Tax=Mollisia scopiformis TaxID=149040 RepID=A0A194XDX5_MOLSC|nr:uncharacterized protein LY89DRAFT_668531 [Mollisia scopiformis]KUJ18378.1 hypothetical protein LY89DRAFT_668531 [Mollisia scopiformis]